MRGDTPPQGSPGFLVANPVLRWNTSSIPSAERNEFYDPSDISGARVDALSEGKAYLTLKDGRHAVVSEKDINVADAGCDYP
jgi:hypothetical protein